MPDWLRQRAALSPDKVALIFGADCWTFHELERHVIQLAHHLASFDLHFDDHVAVLLRNSPQFVMFIHAISLLGGTLVPLNARLTAAEIGWQLADSGARLLIYDPPNAANALAAARELPMLRLIATTEIDQLPEADVSPIDGHQSADIHSIIYTSGTTGRPKGAMLTYGNFWNSSIASALNLGLHIDDRWLACLPLFHVGGLSIVLKGVIYGIPLVLHEAFDADAVNRAIDQDSVTILSAVSVMLQRMLDARGAALYPPTLRCILLGGGPAPQPLLELCAARNVPVVQTYGLTEAASQVATLAPTDALRKLGSAGKPLMLTELRIEQNDQSVSSGEIGEIVVRGPTVTAGYWHQPEATAKALRGGCLHTGDLGYLDTEGYLYVVDRRDDMIISGGENVYPAEIEAILLSHPAVEEAGVTSIPDARWGQVPVAVIKVRNDAILTESDLQTFCYERLARYKVPAQIQFAATLPRNAAGKLLRRALTKWFDQTNHLQITQFWE